ncbi:hypothetical protein DCAR_0831720 [Daucus carota subsp. sativus]|uniref:Peptidase M48 domain-containing protein n=1 Tax=Daucus carota subsp. sativus TaxID=79200 RepID=A0AAF1BBU8_DAUCS|nr:PREDICTED: uncharacterized protein LOC108198340 [Daucus carota subsp. sativus]WOH12218.1 hypothetical protein DCAR_0831720 [Daucus carota subsp. sativus]
MSLLRLCSQSVRVSSVLRFQSGSAPLYRSASCASFPNVNTSAGPKIPLNHFAGTRHYSVPRILGYIFWPLNKCLRCVTYFTGRFETVPFTNQRLYYNPYVEDIWGRAVYNNSFKKLNKCHVLYPQSHPQCVQVEAIAIRILEALQRESGRRHKLADREWILKLNGTLKVVKKRREQNVKSTTAHLKDGIDWEFFVVDTPLSDVSYISEGRIWVCRGSFDVYKTDDELAITIATEVGHIVARHKNREFLLLEPCLLYHRLINGDNRRKHYQLRHEHEADYIAMLLSASAGFDPRVAPVALQKINSERHLSHLMEERMKYMTQPEVMQKAVDIYEERRKGCAIN